MSESQTHESARRSPQRRVTRRQRWSSAPAAKQEVFASRRPHDERLLRTFPRMTDHELGATLRRATDTYGRYAESTFEERAERLSEVARILDSNSEGLGKLMATEMGKPVRQAVAEVEKCAWLCRFYAERADEFLQHRTQKGADWLGIIRYEPLGVVLAIMPWNFPFWQLFRSAVPSLTAGNVVLHKPAPNVPMCALRIAEIFREAGFERGAFQTVLASTDQVAWLLRHPQLAGVTLTGGILAGRAVASAAGSHLKKSVLELGGSDPLIIMPSASLERAVEAAVDARLQNSGQSCIAAKRIIVSERVYDDFLSRFVPAIQSRSVGSPFDETTEVGPLAKKSLLEELDRQVQETAAAGASVLVGGRPLDGLGFFYPPTVLTGVSKDSPAYREELFGPVAPVFRVADVEEAIGLANDTRYGLAASVWTSDSSEQRRFARELECGQVTINGIVESDPRLPFGGIKASGYGRELGPEGVREFVNVKTVRFNA